MEDGLRGVGTAADDDDDDGAAGNGSDSCMDSCFSSCNCFVLEGVAGGSKIS